MICFHMVWYGMLCYEVLVKVPSLQKSSIYFAFLNSDLQFFSLLKHTFNTFTR